MEVPAHSIQLTPLRSFAMVAQLGSFAAVARTLGYSEPAVHLQIAGLKKLAGGELFQRAGRQMELTPLGERLLPYALEAVRAVDQLAAEIANWQATENRLLRIGLGRSSGTYLFPYVAAVLGQSHPQLLIQPSIMPLAELTEALTTGTIDLGIITSLRTKTGGSGPRRIVAVPLAPYYWTLVARQEFASGSPARGEPPLVFVPDYSDGMIQEIQDRVRPTVGDVEVQVCPNGEAAKANALAGRGFAYLPEYVCRLEIASGELASYMPPGARQRSTVDVGHVHSTPHANLGSIIQSLRGLRGLLLQPAPCDPAGSE